MITGVRFSHLAVGEPLLGAAWEYKGLTGKAAVIKRLEDIFYNASFMGFNYIVDTVKPMIGVDGKLTLVNNGVYGDLWTFDERMKEYERLCASTGITLLLEFEFPTEVTEDNVDEYIRFFLSDLVVKYDWVKNWQIGVLPDEINKHTGNYKCSPQLYTRMMTQIYKRTKNYNSLIKIGGPGIFSSLSEYVSKRTGWFAEAIGDLFDANNKVYAEIGMKGFLPYIDFFGFQGRQDTNELNYTNYPHIIEVLKETLYKRLGDNSISLFSTSQGWKANTNNDTALSQQGYYDIREILRAVKCGVVPFKNELVDEYPDEAMYTGQFNKDRQDYGILYWYLSPKPAYADYQFIVQGLKDYNDVYKDSKVFEDNENIDCITFRKVIDGSVLKATVIWPKTVNTESVVLLPASYEREYQLENGNRRVLSEATEIQLENTKFIIVFERIEQLKIDIDDIKKLVTRKMAYQHDTMENLLSLLPSSYNKEVTDTNFYRLLRAIAVDMGDAKITLDMVKDDLYLEQARDEAIYKNFGVLVKLKKKSEWTYEKYRRLVRGVTKSLLDGPTYQSVVDALQLFTNFKVSISELYKDYKKYDSDMLKGVNPQFAFIVEVEKPLEDKEYTQEGLQSDCKFILNIVKPAHTISILIIVLSGKENWQQDYADKHHIPWKNMDTANGALKEEFDTSSIEGIFGWKHISYDGVFRPGKFDKESTLNNGNLIGPRYTLYDRLHTDCNIIHKEAHDTVKLTYDFMLSALDVNVKDKFEEVHEKLLDFSFSNEELKFGFYDDGLIQLTGGIDKRRILNKFKLGCRSKLKDEYTSEGLLFLKETYIFSNTIDTIRFTNKYGFNHRFINQNENILEIAQFLKEHSFKEKIVELDNGKKETRERIIEELQEFSADARDFADVKKTKEKVDFQILSANNETVMFRDDPDKCLTLAKNTLNKHKLGPNMREYSQFDQLVKETYDKAKDFLINELSLYFEATYDTVSEVHDFLELGPEYTDDSTELLDEELFGIRLNTKFLTAHRTFVKRRIATSEFSTYESAKYDKARDFLLKDWRCKLNDSVLKPFNDELTFVEEFDDVYHIDYRSIQWKLNEGRLNYSTLDLRAYDSCTIVNVDMTDEYKFTITESCNYYATRFYQELYAPKKDAVHSDITFGVNDENLTEDVRTICFMLNNGKLNYSLLYTRQKDYIPFVSITNYDTYVFKTIDEMSFDNDIVIDYHYKVQEDKLLAHMVYPDFKEKLEYHWTDKATIDPTFFDRFKSPIESVTIDNDILIDYNYNVYQEHMKSELFKQFEDEKVLPSMSPERITLNETPLNRAGFGIRKDVVQINSISNEKINKPIESFSKSIEYRFHEKKNLPIELKTISAYAQDEFPNLENDVDDTSLRFGLNHSPLGRKRLVAGRGERLELGQYVKDVYDLPIAEKDEAEVGKSEHYTAAKEILEGPAINAHETHILQNNFANAFRFTLSKFNQKKFAMNNLLEDTDYNCLTNEVYNHKLLTEHKDYTQDYVEQLYAPKTDKYTVHYNYLNNDKYIYNVDELYRIDNEVFCKEKYRLKSVVTYMTLEKYINGQVIILRKGTLV